MREPAEQGRSACAGLDRADAGADLAWLCPGAGTLAALARSPSPDLWVHLRHDPALLLLLLRQPGKTLAERLESAELLPDILRRLDDSSPGYIDWNAQALRPILDAGICIADLAASLARATGLADPVDAWTAGLLAPLGWYAICAVNPGAASACLTDPALRTDPLATQRRHWGADAPMLGRRLARRWQLPTWIEAIVGHLALPADVAEKFGANAFLFRLVRLAIDLSRERGHELGLPATDRTADAAALELLPEDLARFAPAPVSPRWEDPHGVPLLRDLLHVAAENRRLRQGTLLRRIEIETDRLHDALEAQIEGEAARLQTSKLAALAEFAAGAGHEINNPLAVISGQAQYILNHPGWFHPEAGEGSRKSLQTIVTQAKRIHSLLRDVMQFARPAVARPTTFEVGELLIAAAADLRELAEQRHVRLEVQVGPNRVRVHADRDQVKTAAICLLRNAIEAAPAEGWARFVVHVPSANRVLVAVEDSGPGPDETQQPHLFDPFFSGRSAGRGRGLGLPTAWRLIRLQGGDVRFDTPRPETPTRFLLELPWSAQQDPVPVITTPLFPETIGINGSAIPACHRGGAA